MPITGLLGGYNEQRAASTNYLAQLDAMRRAQIAQQLEADRMASQQQQFAQEMAMRQQQAQRGSEMDRARMAFQERQYADESGLRNREFGLRERAADREDQSRNALRDIASMAGNMSDEELGRSLLAHNPQLALGLIKESRETQRADAKNQALLAKTGGTGVQAPSGYRWSQSGDLEPIKGGPSDPDVIASKKATGANATEDERKASGWLAQAVNAYNNMANVMQANPDASGPGFFEAAAGSIGADGVANMLRSPERQKFVQAASSFAEAALRAATGAGVTEAEAKQKIQELTPQYTDDLPVRQQKLESMKVYLDSLGARAGRADTSFIPQRAEMGGAQQSQTFNSLPDPRQYSGKTVRDTATGTRWTSNGRDWVRAQ